MENEVKNVNTEHEVATETAEPKKGFFTRCGEWMDANTKKLAFIVGGCVIGGIIVHNWKKNAEMESEDYEASSEDDVYESSDESVSNED